MRTKRTAQNSGIKGDRSRPPGANDGAVADVSARKTVTFLMLTNRKGRTHSLTLSDGWLKAVVSFILVLSVIGAAAVVDYLGLLGASIENRRLRAENSLLREQFQVVEGKLNALEGSLERVRGFVTKLKLITNIETEDRSLKLALGPSPRAGQPIGGAETIAVGRNPAALGGLIPTGTSVGAAEQDSVFFRAPAPDENAGEIASEQARDYASLAIRIDTAVQDVGIREQGVLELWESLSERQNLLAATPSIKPVRGWFTSKFGYRISPFTSKPVMHAGLDVAAAPGSPIYAPADGIVSFAGYDPGYGKLVSVDHGYGVVTRFGHTSQIYVELGQKIKRRDIIAAVGSTGRSTGPHLHYEVRVNDVPVDPSNYILDE